MAHFFGIQLFPRRKYTHILAVEDSYCDSKLARDPATRVPLRTKLRTHPNTPASQWSLKSHSTRCLMAFGYVSRNNTSRHVACAWTVNPQPQARV